ncbi:nickel/cobalt transporter [Ciceribacter sp. L1K23]|uniref:nickel/cobalt transporter n=1 Tax=Ciceribacter sp. L1K23 TaxID=2820276 RepID=UPI001B8297CB|nr:nickel/cobalt transporter [Ciceribacter sp. L1K23]MBR0558105.1 nickel/cobalt transporter [Ciceribacter sp. L1K23]
MLSGRRAVLIAALICLAVPAAHALAASPLGIGTAEPSFQTTGIFGGFLAWVNEHQQAFYRSLTGALKEMRDDPAALWSLIGLSFAYGIFHAAGPGHGKAVVSSYLLANETQLRRGIAISFVSAMMQAFVAIAVVVTAYILLRGSSIKMTDATNALEIASYAMVLAFGTWLLLKKLQPLLPRRKALVGDALFANSEAATLPSGGSGLRFSAVAVDHDHNALAPGSVCPDCGVSHLPDPSMLRGERFTSKEAWSAIVAVGLRPCSGALLVLAFSVLNGLYLGGVLSVFAMALGTAITVSALAITAVSAKGLAIRLTGAGSGLSRKVGNAIEIGAALLVILLGGTLLMAALQG